MTNKLSLSFYAEDTLRMQKQVILDDCDEIIPILEGVEMVCGPEFIPKSKTAKPKTPVMRVQKPKEHNKPQMRKSLRMVEHPKPTVGGVRSSSRSSRDKKNNNPFLEHLSTRIDLSAKGWNALRPLFKGKTSHHKKP